MASVGKGEGVNSHGKCRRRGVNSHGKCRQKGVNYHGKCRQNRVNVFASHRMSHFSSLSVWLQVHLKCTLFPDCSAGLVLVVVLRRTSNISLSLSVHVVGAPRQRTLRHWPGPQDRRRCVCFTRRHCGGQAKNAVDSVCLSHDAGPVSAQHHQGFGS